MSLYQENGFCFRLVRSPGNQANVISRQQTFQLLLPVDIFRSSVCLVSRTGTLQIGLTGLRFRPMVILTSLDIPKWQDTANEKYLRPLKFFEKPGD